MGMKDTYEKKLQAKLAEWDSEIAKLKEKAAEVEADAQTQYKAEIDSLQQRRQNVQTKLDELHQSGQGAWEDLKAGVELSKNSMEEALNSARARFK